MQEFWPDTAIGPDCSRNLSTSAPTASQRSAISLMKVTLHRQESIGGIFGKFRRLGADEYDRCIAQCEGLIKTLHDFATLRIIAADKHAIGMGKIANGRALAQKFRIGADDDIQVRPEFTQPSLDLAASADRHG